MVVPLALGPSILLCSGRLTAQRLAPCHLRGRAVAGQQDGSLHAAAAASRQHVAGNIHACLYLRGLSDCFRRWPVYGANYAAASQWAAFFLC
jgi:hypothetical protein